MAEVRTKKGFSKAIPTKLKKKGEKKIFFIIIL